MKLLSLKAQDLFSIGEISIILEKRGLTLTTGYSQDEGSANGSGKSTVANKAILWTLFGRTAGGTKGDDVINRHVEEPFCWGEVKFQGVDGHMYEVTRMRPSALRLRRYIDDSGEWEGLTKRNQNDTQEHINEALGRDFVTFLQTDFFGQGRDKSFLSLTPAQQVEILEQILPIAELTNWSKYAKESQKELRNNLTKLSEEQAYHNGGLTEVHRTIDGLSSQSKNFDTQKLQKVADIKRKLNEYKEATSEKNQRLEELKLKLQEFKEIDLAAYKEDYEGRLEDFNSAKTKVSECETAERQLKTEKEIKKAKLVDINENCPTCKQPLPEQTIRDLLLKQHEIRGELSNLDKYIDSAKQSLEGWRVHAEACELNYKESKKLYDSVVEKLSNKNYLSTEISRLEKDIDPSLQSRLQAELEQAESSKNPYKEAIEFHKNKEKNLVESIEAVQKEIKALEEEVDHLHFWSETFGKDFKTFLFRRACPFLQSRTATHLKGLGNSQLKVEFDTSKTLKSGDERLGFNVNVYSETGGNGFDSLSGGEQQIASFAVGLALADLAETQVKGSSHFLILDEPFMALDDRNCENLVSYLTNELSSRRETILLISNEENLKSLISERIHVEKQNGVTSIAST